MTLKGRLTDDIKTAMKSGDKPRLAVLRLASAQLKQVEVDERIELDDSRVLAIVEKMIKQRRDSISQFDSAGREDLAAQERYEVDVLTEYLPAALSASEIDALIQNAIASSNATGARDMGKVVALVKPQVIGRADMAEVSVRIKAALGG